MTAELQTQSKDESWRSLGVWEKHWQEKLRRIRRQAKHDLLFYAREILGFRKLVIEPWRIHRQMTDFITDDSQPARLLLIPRGFYKTTLVTIADSLHRFVKCLPDLPEAQTLPSYNQSVLLVGPTDRDAARWMRILRGIVEKNSVHQTIFPELEPDWSNWTSEHMKFQCTYDVEWEGSHITAIGMGGSATSQHHSIVKFDDVVNLKNYRTPSLREMVREYYEGMQPILHASGREFIVGTRYHYDDVYHHILSQKTHHVMLRGCEDSQGHSLLPEQYPDEWLAMMRKKMGVFYNSQYLNDPSPREDAIFRDERIQTYFDLPTDAKLDIVGVVDPSTGAKYGDPAGIIVMGENLNGDWYVLHSESHNYAPEELAKRLVYLQSRLRPRLWLVESNGCQAALRPVLDKIRRESSHYMRLKWTGSETQLSKEARVQDFAHRCEIGNVFLRPSDIPLRLQMRHWPNPKHDDVLDAAGYLSTLFRSRSSMENEMPPDDRFSDFGIGLQPRKQEGWI